MYPKDHLIASIIVAAVMFPFFQWWSLLIIIGGYLIDVDHYILYVLKFKDLSLKNAYDYHAHAPKLKKGAKPEIHLYIFHTIEGAIFIAGMIALNIIFLPLWIGIILHMALDFYWDTTHESKEIKRAWSLIGYLMKR